MSVLVNDQGFDAEDWTHGFTNSDDLGQIGDAHPPAMALAVDVNNTVDVATLSGMFDRIDLIRLDFPNSADGRAFSQAARLRMLGFQGRLRARGHVLADQYTMARRAGFDEVEISDDLAARQPQAQWQFRADWQAHDYQARLRQFAR